MCSRTCEVHSCTSTSPVPQQAPGVSAVTPSPYHSSFTSFLCHSFPQNPEILLISPASHAVFLFPPCSLTSSQHFCFLSCFPSSLPLLFPRGAQLAAVLLGQEAPRAGAGMELRGYRLATCQVLAGSSRRQLWNISFAPCLCEGFNIIQGSHTSDWINGSFRTDVSDPVSPNL